MTADSVSVAPAGLRAGWRLVIWVAIYIGVLIVVGLVVIEVFHFREHVFLDPAHLIVADIFFTFIPALVATHVMAGVEGHSLRDYFVPGRGSFARQFWRGLLWGLLAVSLLFGMIAALGGYKILGIEASGSSLVYGAALWIAASLTIGVVEEFTFRAYLLRTLADGVGFWPAAALLSLGFGALHYFGKPHQRWEDFASTALLGLFACFTIRRTGTLAFAIGFHAAFDWGAVYFYSGRNAGEFAIRHLLKTDWPGPDWLTGGLLGPEASWLVFAVIAVLFVFFGLLHRPKEARQTQAA
jgi:uncharacterized protein